MKSANRRCYSRCSTSRDITRDINSDLTEFNIYYCHKLSVVMSARDFAFCVLLITLVRFSMTSVVRPQRLLIVRLSPASTRSLEDIPDKWRTVHSKFKAPQIEIQLLKGHASSEEVKWIFTNEYSDKDYQYVDRRISVWLRIY